MRAVFLFTSILVGIITAGPSSFAVTTQYTEYILILSGSTEIANISYLYGPYNLKLFEPHNEAHHSGLGIIHLSQYRYIDTTLTFIITKTLEKSLLLYQLYLNEDWRRIAEKMTDEYSSHDVTVMSYNHLIKSDTMLLAGFVRSKEMLIKSQTNNTVVLGIYQQLTPRIILAIGAGPNISGGGLSAFRVTAGLQFSF